MKQVLTGNETAGLAALVAGVDVVSAYPITPQTTIIEYIADLIGRGEFKARYIHVESEHSALAGCVSASYAGARTFTATSAQGLLLMHELMHWAGHGRCPIVLANVNRAVAPGWSIWTDQNDSLSQRDTAWMQFYCENNQEIMDTIVQAYKIAEAVMLPAMVVLDAFVLSHTAEIVDIPEKEKVEKFLPPYNPKYKLDVNDPHAFGGLQVPDIYMEFRYNMEEAMKEALKAIKRVGREWGDLFGRYYDTVEAVETEDAEIILVTSAAVTSVARMVVEKMRGEGKKVGLLKVRTFRPFPFEDVKKYLSNAQKVAVVDRNLSFGYHGIFYQEIKSALYPQNNERVPKIYGFVAGIGGRDVKPGDFEQIVRITEETPYPAERIYWIGLKK
jgi:pyruvate/2-oxoacid:ferredoxin oxidoreductase alpha subunit